MKKSLLIAAAVMFAFGVNAQLVRTSGHVSTTSNAVATQQLKNAKIEHRTGQRATGPIMNHGPRRVIPAASPYYVRPVGTMYANWDNTGSGFIMPFVFTTPYNEVTWRNFSTATGTPSWGYKVYNSETQATDSLVSNDWDLTVTYGYEYEDVPALTMGKAGTYELSGYNLRTGASATSGVASVINSDEIFEEGYMASHLLCSAHYYGSSDRFGTQEYGWSYYSGAYGPDYNPDLDPNDPAQDRSGYWFGRNWMGYNAIATGFEKPITPYVLNNIYFWVTAFNVTEDVELTAHVYRLPDGLPQYCDSAAVVNPELLNEDNLIATGVSTLTTEMNEDGSPILKFDLFEYDPAMDMNYEVTPEIDDAILIVITGLDQEPIVSLSGLFTTDEEDEGIGEVTYIGHSEDGVVTSLRGINNFFTSGEFKTGNSIFIDVSRPFMVFNFNDETGEYTFPNEGGNYMFAGQYEGVNIYAADQYGETVTAGDLYYSLEDGNDVPDWLTIELADDQQYGGVQAKVTCAALPEGLSGREAKVKFFINGANLVYDFKQGNVVEPANKLYVIGDDPLGGWNPAAPIEMTENEETEGVFTYTVNVEEAKDIYFVFTEGIGSWAEVNGHRYGPTDADQDVVVGENMTTQLSSNDQAAYRLAAVAGEYTITFNKNTMTFRVDGEVAPEPDYKLHYGVEGAEWQDATFVPGEGENEGKLVAADVEFAANTEFKVNHGAEWYGGVAEEGEEAYLIHYGWCENIPLDLTGKNFRINEAGTYTFVLTIGEESKTLTVLGLVAPGVPGDSNGDGVVDIADVNSVINQMLGKEAMIPACDMNGDGVIDIADVNAVINKMLGK